MKWNYARRRPSRWPAFLGVPTFLIYSRNAVILFDFRRTVNNPLDQLDWLIYCEDIHVLFYQLSENMNKKKFYPPQSLSLIHI